eukprot:scaffold177715_cov17-Prasinocladus_malaysianus.AAC.1
MDDTYYFWPVIQSCSASLLLCIRTFLYMLALESELACCVVGVLDPRLHDPIGHLERHESAESRLHGSRDGFWLTFSAAQCNYFYCFAWYSCTRHGLHKQPASTNVSCNKMAVTCNLET